MAPRSKCHPVAEQKPLVPRIKVLLVHEDPALLTYYHEILVGLGFEVVALSSYAEGLAWLERESSQFIVVSQGSRSFEGRSILERAMQIDRQARVLIVTRCRSMANYLDAMQLGAVDYLEEPIEASELVRALKSQMRARASSA